MTRYALASLIPAAALALGALLGGTFWPLAGLLSMTALVFVADRRLGAMMPTAGGGRGLLVTLVAAHLLLWALGLRAIGGAQGLDGPDRALLFLGLGLFFGQISNSCAHELIHQPLRALRRLGALVYVTLLNGHHTSAHLHVHHVHAATPADPNTARAGEGFYRFALRALAGEYLQGLRAETARRARARTRGWHPYAAYAAGAGLAVGLAFTLAGVGGVLALLGLAAYAHLQLLLSDYVQHYGLMRAAGRDGRLEPMGPQHSWNAAQRWSGAMMLNAPRHSDHHLRPARPYGALRIDPDAMPILPHSLPVMAMIALAPPFWRRMMDPRLARWRNTASPTNPASPANPDARQP